MTNIIGIRFSFVQDQNALECISLIENHIGILAPYLKNQILVIMGEGYGFTPGLQALRNDDIILIQYNNYTVNNLTNTIQIDLNQNTVTYRDDLIGAIHQFPYGNYFKLEGPEGKNSVQILNSEFEVVETFDRVNVLGFNWRFKLFYQGIQNGIFDSLTGEKIYLDGKLKWCDQVTFGNQKEQQIFMVQNGKSLNSTQEYCFVDHTGKAFEGSKFYHNFGYHESFSIYGCTNNGAILINVGKTATNTNLYFVINCNGFFTIDSELIMHCDDSNLFAYHPLVLGNYDEYQKVKVSTSMLDDISQSYKGEETYKLFDKIQTPQLVNT